jgi:hypothetical protein
MRLQQHINEKSVKTSSGSIRVTKPSRSIGQKMVDVNVYAFDESFKKDRSMYVGARGSGGIGKRYDNFEIFVRGGDLDIGDGVIIPTDKAKSIEVPEVSVLEDGSVQFTNGRHRWAWLRDQGAKTIPVMMDVDSIVNAKKYGYIK